MKKHTIVMVLFAACFANADTYAQVSFGPRPVRFYRSRPARGYSKPAPPLPHFEPAILISAGYGFPNLDKNKLPQFTNVYRGNFSQTGPFNAAIDYQFSRSTSIGALVTHGSFAAPYYSNFGSSVTPAFTANIENWSFMLNILRYLPGNAKVRPYIRTAIGVNSWTQSYTDPTGNKADVLQPVLPDFAYQVGLGAKFNLSKHAGIFLEAGYGKYILNGGLAVKF